MARMADGVLLPSTCLPLGYTLRSVPAAVPAAANHSTAGHVLQKKNTRVLQGHCQLALCCLAAQEAADLLQLLQAAPRASRLASPSTVLSLSTLR